MQVVNIHNSGRIIHLFIRDNNFKPDIIIDKTFYPYFYEPHLEGEYTSYDNTRLKKIFVTEPSKVRELRSQRSWESDILFTKRYMIDKIQNIDKTAIKYFFIDIEVLANKEFPEPSLAKFPISCISIYNSEKKHIKTFFIQGYLLSNYTEEDILKAEEKLLNDFINYMKCEKPDIFISWNVKFDYNYLYHRAEKLNIKFANEISPIRQVRRPNKKVESDDIFYPAGISIVDFLLWFKKFTLNRRKSYGLDYIAQYDLQEESYKEIDFGIISNNIKNKNINDIHRMIKLNEKYKLIAYYDNIRRMSKCFWEDLYFNSRVFEMLLFEEAKNQKVVLQNKKENKKEDFEGAIRESDKGFFKDIGKYDIISTYPNMIINFCLDPSNISETEIENSIKIDIRDKKTNEITKSYWYKQNKKALLPATIDKILKLKEDIKIQKKNTSVNAEIFEDIKLLYDSIKAVCNSGFGVFGNRFFRMYDKRIAETITSLVRELLNYIKEELEKMGYIIRFYDTDSMNIETTEDLTDILNNLVKQWGKERYNIDTSIQFEREGIFERILLLGRCHYVGYLNKGKEIEKETKGIEAKKKDCGKYMGKFQKTLIDMILEEKFKEEIISWIREEIKNFKNNSLFDIAIPTKLNQEYIKNIPIQLRAYNNTIKKIENFKKGIGEWFYYIYIIPEEYEIIEIEKEYLDNNELTTNILKKEYKNYFKLDKILKKDIEEEKMNELIESFKKDNRYEKRIEEVQGEPIDVIGFDEKINSHIDLNKIDWNRMIERNILMKCEAIFEAMKWDINEVKT